MAINEIPSNKPAAPVDLTEVGENKPAVPSNLTEQAASTPIAPANLTELIKGTVTAPTNLTELVSVTPVNPVNLNEVVALSPVNPANLTELSALAPVNPVNLTEIAESTPIAPANLTELASAGINRTLVPLFNFNSDLGLPDSVTYSRASDATYLEEYVGPLGRKQKRIALDYVGDVENLALYSQDFDNAVWTTSNAIKSSLGGEFVLIEDTANSEHRLDQNTAAATFTQNTYTIRAKYFKNRGIFIRRGDVHGAFFDLLNGVITSQTSDTTASIKYVGDGFYDCSVTIATATNSQIRVDLVKDGSTRLYVGDGVSGVIFKQAQLTESAKPLPYVRTFDVPVTETFTANPRYEEKGLLVEGASTNLLLRSEEHNVAPWTSTALLLVFADQQLAPDGSFSAEGIIPNTAVTPHQTNQVITGTTAGISYTLSIFVKAAITNKVFLFDSETSEGVNFDLSTGTIISELSAVGKIEDYGNGWFRISSTSTSVGTQVGFRLRLLDNDANPLFAGVGSNPYIYQWGAQVEALPFATSYIRTEGATASRAFEGFSSSLYGIDFAGTLLVESSYLGSTADLPNTRTPLLVSDGTANNRYIVRNQDSDHNAFFIVSNGATQNTFNENITYDNSETLISVLSYASNFGSYYINGILKESAAFIQPQGINRIDFNTTQTGFTTIPLNGHIKRIEIYDTAATANEVKTL